MTARILDKNLWFLEECTNSELEVLFNILSFEQNQIERSRGRLLYSIESQVFEEDYFKYIDKIGLELQVFANSSIAGLLRAERVPYIEILKECFDVLEFDHNNKKEVISLEKDFIEALYEKALGIKNSGVSSLPFEILVEESMTEEVKNSPRLRCILPAVIYISLLRADLGKNKIQEGKETILK